MQIYIVIVSACRALLAKLREHWIVATLAALIGAVVIQISSGFFGPIGGDLLTGLRGWGSSIINAADLKRENDELRKQLKDDVASASQLTSSFFVLPNRGRKHCREFVRDWAAKSGYTFKADSDEILYISKLVKADKEVFVRCVGTTTSAETYGILYSSGPNDDELRSIHDRLGVAAQALILRREVLFASNPPDDFLVDQWSRPGAYGYALTMRIPVAKIPVSSWEDEAALLKVVRDNLPEISKYADCSNYDADGNPGCAFTLPRLSARLFLSDSDVVEGEYSVIAIVATQNYGSENAYSSSTKFFGDDFDLYLRGSLSVTSAYRTFQTW